MGQKFKNCIVCNKNILLVIRNNKKILSRHYKCKIGIKQPFPYYLFITNSNRIVQFSVGISGKYAFGDTIYQNGLHDWDYDYKKSNYY